ncbi:hypothetical protein [Psychrobacter sp. DAB_AL43B]|uniref:hypothetical protein n=1 Tax=Psychrobacter sp. DAB_AL43B TaxID=1028416 RepID=UPI0009A8180A|nr:hypothetical protein [Psychrobacter sp. DAB_AL43B]SLJ84451.1 hypothetical protein DABAL43B_1255 [Psychrobacter sp. DAB_AL43B]
MTTYHMKQSIAGCLRNNRVGTIDFLEDKNGNPLSDAEARIELNNLLAMGHTVMPVGTDCEGFDVFGGGCPGHELLTGSDLTRAMLARGDSRVVCLVSNVSDSHATERRELTLLIEGYTERGNFWDIRSRDWRYAVPVSAATNEPLTAKEVGL